ncbi:hypothetical protein [Nocardioides sp. 616]|uniref:hypothetical protein n=1 Tax=Nocardioides sp. 616 TaxID=2268090 RepID=UPI000CE447DA|nr:hypothetical protein [Nocardioides sp. 616]
MRAFRALTALIVAVLLGTSLLGPATAHARNTDNPKRIVEVNAEKKLDYRSFRYKGTVEALPNGKVLLEKKSCGKCKWKTVKKLKTNDAGKFRTKIFTPNKGKWLWRTRVNAQGGYARSYSRKIATFFK